VRFPWLVFFPGGYEEAETFEEGVTGGVEGAYVWFGIANGGYEEGEGFGWHCDGGGAIIKVEKRVLNETSRSMSVI
jgi:hypothetical protein